jgi:hypothetical protein
MSLVTLTSLARAPLRHGLLVRVLTQGQADHGFKRVATLSDERPRFTLVWTAPRESNNNVFTMDVIPIGRCKAELRLMPLSAVQKLAPALPAAITPGSVVEFDAVRGWDEVTHFRLLVIGGKTCATISPAA